MKYSMSLLAELEAETGQSTGFRQVGSLSVAHSHDRFEELKRVAAMNNAFGVPRVDTVTAEEIVAHWDEIRSTDGFREIAHALVAMEPLQEMRGKA